MLFGEDGRGTERGVGRSCGADGEGGHWYSGGHLHDGEQGIDAAERLRLHRYAQYGETRLGGGHAGKVRRTARAGDDDLQTPRACARGVLEEQVGGTVGGD